MANNTMATARHNAAALAELRDLGGDELVAELIDIFASHAPGLVSSARAGYQSGDAAAVSAALHSLKSSSAQLGAARVSELCASGERQAKMDLPGVGAVIGEIERELPASIAWMRSAARR